MDDLSPRAAAALLSGALAHLDVIQPPALRGPVRDILRAGIEICVTSQSLLGRPIQHTLDLAQAVTGAAENDSPPRRTVFDTNDREAYWASRNEPEG